MMDDKFGAVGGMLDRKKPKYSQKTCPKGRFVHHKSHMT
jgi:hypothetical protein